MRIQYTSDLHLEFSLMPVIKNAGADVLVLAGDILVAERFNRKPPSPYSLKTAEWLQWFENTCANFSNVIYIMGNHEHYSGNFHNTYNTLKMQLSHISNLHILDKQYVDIDNVRFFGGTMWTDFDHSTVNMMMVKQNLNDYHVVQSKGYRKLQPEETARCHADTKQAILDCLTDNMVIVSHHAPSYRSVNNKYKSQVVLNSGYASHMDSFVDSITNSVKLWIHGHMHDSVDYMISNTRVVANPRGYQKVLTVPPENSLFDSNKVVKI